MAMQIQIKRGLKANLASAGVIAGELKYTTDEHGLYIGDGSQNILLNPSAPADTAAHDADMTMDSSTYVITFQLKDKDGNYIGTQQTIDLPLEELVVSVEYVASIPEGTYAGKKGLKITLKNGNVTYVPLTDLISGLVNDTRKVAGYALSADVTAQNIEDACKELTAELKNKTIDADNNTLSNIDATMFKSTVAGTGLAINGGTLNHSNAVTAVAVADKTLAKFSYDAQGHITSSAAIALNTAIAAEASDEAVLSEKAIKTALGGKVDNTIKVAGQALTADVTAATIADATKAETVTLTNKTINAANNTLSNIDASMFAAATAGAGLAIDGTALKHSNAVTAVSTQTMAKFAYDAQGHITASTAIGLNTAIAETPLDTNILTEKAVKTALDGKVDTTRTVAGKALSADVSASDIEDATKELTATYKNKSIDAADNTISGLSGLNFASGKIGTGLTSNATTGVIDHSNSVTAVETETMAKFTYDAQGHVTGSTAIALNTAIGATPSDAAVLTEKAVDTALGLKVDKTITVAGKALSANVTAADIDDACKAVTTTFANKTIDAGSNTITNLSGANFGENMIGAGLQVNSTTNAIEHSNAVTAVTTEALAKVAYDAQGHVTSSTAVGMNTAMAATPSDGDVLTEKAVDTFVKSGTVTFTNKTFDANGTGNSLSNVEVADFASGVVRTAVRATATAEDDKLATEKAIATGLAAKVDIAQGSENAGKILMVNADGNLALVSAIDCGSFDA